MQTCAVSSAAPRGDGWGPRWPGVALGSVRSRHGPNVGSEASFVRDFSEVKVRDVVKNVTQLAAELRASTRLSDETVSSVLEANVSRGQVGAR